MSVETTEGRSRRNPQNYSPCFPSRIVQERRTYPSGSRNQKGVDSHVS